MPIVHFLNVKQGDCSLIEHSSGHLTVIDVCNASEPNRLQEAIVKRMAAAFKGVRGDFGQRNYPVNPISYMADRGMASVFRFILTHPDMDHMDGIRLFFKVFRPLNFWDTDNNETKDFSDDASGEFSEEDWNFYVGLRDGKPDTDPRRLTLYSGDRNKYFNLNDQGEGGGDGLNILAPTPGLLSEANETGDYNDSSYVLLYRTGVHRLLFGGDSHDKTWEHILNTHEKSVTDVDVLIAPHHGRRSDRSYDFLDVVNPALTLFGNADSSDLAYGAFSSRGLPIITNNQAGSILLDADKSPIEVYVTNRAFAEAVNGSTYAAANHAGYYYHGLVERE